MAGEMNFGSNAAFDLADERAEQEREAGLASARAALSKTGRDDCEDCGCTIPHARRLAYPCATRCVDCQQAHENEESAR